MTRSTALVAMLAVASFIACSSGTDSAARDTVTAKGAFAGDSAVGTPDAGATSGAGATTGAASSSALIDPNSATREQLLALPGLSATAADALIQGRPYNDMLAVNAALSPHVGSADARRRIYERLWKPIDLNTAKADEILLVPGVGPRMRREFEEYRPYRNIEQFRREIGKYVDEKEVARLERYVTVR